MEVMRNTINNNNNNEESPRKWSDVSIRSISSIGSLHSLEDEEEDVKLTGSFRCSDLQIPTLVVDEAAVLKEERLKGRRKSWHVGKFEKKRRKGSFFGSLHIGSSHSSRSLSPNGGGSSNGIAGSQDGAENNNGLSEKGKKLPWWNVLDHWPRGKSRSVDHGLTSPFDLQSLRNKVESRFDRLTRDADSCSGSKEQLAEKKMEKPKPIRTTMYKVGSSDTLTSVAARFDTTPSELAILNRLPARTVFPGQIIKVPEKNKKEGDAEAADVEEIEDVESGSLTDEATSEGDSSHRRLSESDGKEEKACAEEDLLETLRPSSPKPGFPERVHSPQPKAPHKPIRALERFLKINVRHITDGQGVVGGVLLVTPNAVMFDPNVSDQLVIEHGPESYGVIAPMEFVVNAAIYHDIAHMRVAHAPHNLSDSGGKPEIYHATEKQRRDSLYRPGEERNSEQEASGHSEASVFTNQPDSLDSANLDLPSMSPGRSDSVLTAKDEESRSSEEDNGSMCSCEEREIAAFPKAFDQDLVVQGEQKERKKKSSVLKRSDEATENDDEGDENQKQRAHSAGSSHRESGDSVNAHLVDAEAVIRHLEERRKSSLDHHWAVPARSIDAEQPSCPSSSTSRPPEEGEPLTQGYSRLEKQSCHDSGIDVREPSIVVKKSDKKAYSDADILLSDGNEFLPPLPVKQLSKEEDNSKHHSGSVGVSFNLEEDAVSVRDGRGSKSTSSGEEAEKQAAESKKNKMLKRLSYPLAWMEGITGEKDDKETSLPSSAESSQPSHSSSVFSKVFSSSPINMVTDFGSGLFLSKTPSEENKFQFPPSGSSSVSPSHSEGMHQQRSFGGFPHRRHHHSSGARCATPSSVSSEPYKTSEGHHHKREGFASFSPSSIIHSVGRSSVSSFIRQQHQQSNRSDSTKSAGPRLDYRSMVSVEDMPELFVSFDKLIPRPARSCDDPPLYLRLRMGKPKNRKIPKNTPIMSYGKKKMRPEYWFSVPRNRVDDLYKFLHLWVPHLYGDLDETAIEERGYELVDSDTELWNDVDEGEEECNEDEKRERRRSSSGEFHKDITRESWEVIKAPYAKIYNLLKNQADHFGSCDTQQSDEVLSMSEELRRALYASSSLDLELFLPDLNGTTEILTEDHRKQISKHLPARAEGYVWTLVFSTSQHGFSLNSMYRKMNKVDSPILMVIQDTDSNVFGALTSCALNVSEHFYGNGESLLFSFKPEFHVYHWTGDNQYFIKGNNESLSIGAGDGKFGIWLDGDLFQGRTEACATYGNEPLVPNQDFVVKTLECWAFL